LLEGIMLCQNWVWCTCIWTFKQKDRTRLCDACKPINETMDCMGNFQCFSVQLTKLMTHLKRNRENTMNLLPRKPPIFQNFYLKLGPKWSKGYKCCFEWLQKTVWCSKKINCKGLVFKCIPNVLMEPNTKFCSICSTSFSILLP